MLRSVWTRNACYASRVRTLCVVRASAGDFGAALKDGPGHLPQVNSDAQKPKAPKVKVYRSTIEEIHLKILNGGAGATFGVGDLTCLLKAWGRPDNADANQKKHLNDLEMIIIPQLESINVHRSVTLLYTYARVGRKFPPVLDVLNKTISDKLINPVAGELSLLPKRILEALWSNAQLNDRAAYLPYLIPMCLSHCMEEGKTWHLCEVLLSLATLQKLDLPTFMSAKVKLEEAVAKEGPAAVNVAQLRHVWNEVQILLKEQGIDPVQWQRDQNVTTTNSQDTSITYTLPLLPWQVGYDASNTNTPLSSHNHVALSHALRAMGVPHQNEATLTNGLLVDILIPNRAFAMDPAECKGVVVEYDGPFHFESYGKAELGSTLIKRRHIQAAGYKMISIPYWRLKQDPGGGTAAQEKILKQFFLLNGLRLKL